ncbi:hypothetical protein HYH03_016581 [Edaphochlamys debaryana]|uniref:Methyltransferase FkbM domain-containing protein n=1 Tax=Edaphochlamys debaryana TaxID=47281 RepID=A0A835XK29_9CHLO|nr:hypothetical protein HYH03_016581 [Edaphochlamys debaryana]|eukprot:KAG2484627.1 hypothetical protein HYH03_016581 [Edaphochlamys debaryana]
MPVGTKTAESLVVGSGTTGTREICTNTCNKAKNGICEEGRPAKGKPAVTLMFMTYCDLGTDCDDCGPFATSAPAIEWEDPKVVGPIRFLQAKDVQVRVRQALVPPEVNFSFAYTDPAADFDVSYHMESSGVVERGISIITYTLLKDRCIKKDGSRALVVDVGANFGWFAVMAARLGCRVIGYEPVPLFRSFFTFSTHINDLTGLIDIRPKVVSHERNKTMQMVVPSKGIWGTAGIDGLNIDRAIQASKEEIDVPSVRLEDEIKEDVLLLKVDVEGWEWSVIQGAEGLLKNHVVENIIMEYSPGVPERHFKWDHMAATPQMLVDLIKEYGYRIGHIGDAGKHHGNWEDPLPALREISMDNLKYDVHDVALWKDAKMACPSPPELARFPMWVLCGGVPEGLNPRSLRAEIGHNTNIIAAKGASLGAPYLKLEGLSGILDPHDPATKYFQTNPSNFGMGSRPCYHLTGEVQVRHRCKCTKPDICGEEEKLVAIAAEEGRIAHNYVLP